MFPEDSYPPYWIQRACVSGPDDQLVEWSPEPWHAEPDLRPFAAEIAAIAQRCHDKGGIDRDWLFTLGDGAPVLFGLAVLAWATGTGAESAALVAATMAGNPDFADRISEIILQARLGIATGWKIFATAEYKIEGIDMGIGTALMHFSAFQHCQPRPLVMNNDVLAGLADAGKLSGGYYLAFYKTYVQGAQELAAKLGLPERPDVIEFAFGERGRRLQTLAPINEERRAGGLPPLL
jgi:hypothetical protein